MLFTLADTLLTKVLLLRVSVVVTNDENEKTLVVELLTDVITLCVFGSLLWSKYSNVTLVVVTPVMADTDVVFTPVTAFTLAGAGYRKAGEDARRRGDAWSCADGEGAAGNCASSCNRAANTRKRNRRCASGRPIAQCNAWPWIRASPA